ncbi:MAG: hypothetical protein ABF288_13565 [Octadecabacter sp.]
MFPELKELDGWLADREAALGSIRARCVKQIVWVGQPERTSVCVVYDHGVSATAAEVRPLPDMMAKALGRACDAGHFGAGPK